MVYLRLISNLVNKFVMCQYCGENKSCVLSEKQDFGRGLLVCKGNTFFDVTLLNLKHISGGKKHVHSLNGRKLLEAPRPNTHLTNCETVTNHARRYYHFRVVCFTLLCFFQLINNNKHSRKFFIG